MKKTTKRRNIYGLPVEIDNHLKLEAEHQNISVNQLFLKIILRSEFMFIVTFFSIEFE